MPEALEPARDGEVELIGVEREAEVAEESGCLLRSRVVRFAADTGNEIVDEVDERVHELPVAKRPSGCTSHSTEGLCRGREPEWEDREDLVAAAEAEA